MCPKNSPQGKMSPCSRFLGSGGADLYDAWDQPWLGVIRAMKAMA